MTVPIPLLRFLVVNYNRVFLGKISGDVSPANGSRLSMTIIVDINPTIILLPSRHRFLPYRFLRARRIDKTSSINFAVSRKRGEYIAQ